MDDQTFRQKTLTPRGLLHATIAEVAREYRLAPELIEGHHCRLKAVAYARAVVAKRLFAHGLPEQRIAKIMHVSMTKVQVYLGRRAQPQKKEEVCHGQDRAKGSGAAGAA
jgi:hypothetical protein